VAPPWRALRPRIRPARQRGEVRCRAGEATRAPGPWWEAGLDAIDPRSAGGARRSRAGVTGKEPADVPGAVRLRYRDDTASELAAEGRSPLRCRTNARAPHSLGGAPAGPARAPPAPLGLGLWLLACACQDHATTKGVAPPWRALRPAHSPGTSARRRTVSGARSEVGVEQGGKLGWMRSIRAARVGERWRTDGRGSRGERWPRCAW
jgi:hypothetical protein